ncbi:NAD(P) transhydrogenase subunit alpha [Actinophytocola sp.]|uniref:NAD(P) transhydrogenase subunit alpha n=1 Tax=Actinophytocola sp. TaxID=1872138 RepID=UPI002D7F6383|nr:NAD(P) transhydrogenase subunit alpha [Actinophytocola sp.]HET9140772.1 NAD(P) transhydrogenase subunit alpha [Actinophytocola sp.]
MKIGVLKERAPGERRVALVPGVVATLSATGAEVLVETGAGAPANFPDSAYDAQGARLVSRAEICREADAIVCVGPPDGLEPRRGQLLVGLLRPHERAEQLRAWAQAGATVVSLDLLPRTLSRAQTMDALTSQATVVGYKAVLVAANAYGGYFPMLVTAAGTVRPASVLVLGAGVAGLQGMGTARRLGAVVTGYDVRPDARDEVRSVGARFLDLPGGPNGGGAGGYARELTDEERETQQQALRTAIGDADVVITTAGLPGHKPPVLVTEEAIKKMRPGSVVVDTAAGPLGGNVALSKPDTATVVDGVTIIGAGNLAAAQSAAASTAYARNIQATLAQLCPGGQPRIDLTDEIQDAIVVAHEGELRHEC